MDSKNLDLSIYENIKSILNQARSKTYSAVNFFMVEAYWNIGRMIFEAQGQAERAEYGDYLLKNLSEKLTLEFGKGFTVTNLKYMRQFYLGFPNGHSMRDQLSWTHYRLLLKIEDAKKRDFYRENFEMIKENERKDI